MHERIKSLSYKAEFVVVILVTFGYFMVGSLTGFYAWFFPPDSSITLQPAPVTDAELFFYMTYQIIVLSLVAWMLQIRNWSLRDFNLEISLRLTIEGLFLWFVFFLLHEFVLNVALLSGLMNSLLESTWIEPLNISTLSPSTIVLTQIINAVFEEIILVGYVVAALEERKGIAFAINTSVFIRLVCHLYEGLGIALFIIPMGLLFAYVYAWRRQLWPLIVAHCSNNVLAFFSAVGGFA